MAKSTKAGYHLVSDQRTPKKYESPPKQTNEKAKPELPKVIQLAPILGKRRGKRYITSPMFDVVYSNSSICGRLTAP